jgi:transposase
MSILLALLPHSSGLRLDDLVLTSDIAVALLTSIAPTVPCPRCGGLSDRVHSHYYRTVADLPFPNRTVVLRLFVRRFRCARSGCPQAIFCERLPGLLQPHARSTDRLSSTHQAIGFALGGEAGGRLSQQLAMPTSPDTLLRRVKKSTEEPRQPTRFLGVDDWALRKGQRYGTILIDLESSRVLDLLPGRDGEALKTWLQAHPGVEVITRDRWPAFAQAATEAAPEALQVADRWHLLKNLREAIETLLGRHSTQVREALKETTQPMQQVAEQERTAASPSLPSSESRPLPEKVLTPTKRARQVKQQERARQYEQVKELRGQGQSLRQIARALNTSVKRVLRYLRSDHCPD